MQSTTFLRSELFRSLLFPKKAKYLLPQLRYFSDTNLQGLNLLGEPVSPATANPFKLCANTWRMARFRTMYDRSFDIGEFRTGANKAFVVVSKKLYNMDFDGLRGLVSDEALERLRPAVEALTDEQREYIDLEESDIYGQFVLSINLEQSQTGNEIFAIRLAFHCFRKMQEYLQQVPQAGTISQLLRFSDRFVMGNMEFAKRIFKDKGDRVDSDWTVTYANYATASPTKIEVHRK